MDHRGNSEIGQDPPEASDEALNSFERNARVRLHGFVSGFVACKVLAERVQVEGVPGQTFNQLWFQRSRSVGDRSEVLAIL